MVTITMNMVDFTVHDARVKKIRKVLLMEQFSALIHLCDREPEKEEESLKTIKEYAEHFVRTYGV